MTRTTDEMLTPALIADDAVIRSIREREHQKWVAARRSDRRQKLALGFGFPVALLLLWQLASSTGMIDARFFPSPLTIANDAASDIANRDLLPQLGEDLLISLRRIALGFGIGAVTGVLVGTTMGTVRRLRYGLGPFVYAVYPMPKLAILPLLLILFGIGDASKVTLVALGVFFVVCISALSGTLYASPMYEDVSRAFALPRMTRYRHVTLPAAMPSIMNGIKLGIGQALILCVSVEFVSSQDGIGAFIWQSWQTFDLSRMFVGLFCIAGAGALAVFGGDALERKLIPWANNR